MMWGQGRERVKMWKIVLVKEGKRGEKVLNGSLGSAGAQPGEEAGRQGHSGT
jgi:hypothetical protein